MPIKRRTAVLLSSFSAPAGLRVRIGAHQLQSTGSCERNQRIHDRLFVNGVQTLSGRNVWLAERSPP